MEKNNKQGDMFITWSPELSVGIKFIDDQHKQLVKLVNDLESHTVGDSESERLYAKKVIKKLLDYVKIHFATEEKLMQQTNFKSYSEHKTEHDKFTLKVIDLVKDFNNNEPLALDILIDYLNKWILNHIAGTDQHYSSCFLKHGISADGANPVLDNQ